MSFSIHFAAFRQPRLLRACAMCLRSGIYFMEEMLFVKPIKAQKVFVFPGGHFERDVMKHDERLRLILFFLQFSVYKLHPEFLKIWF